MSEWQLFDNSDENDTWHATPYGDVLTRDELYLSIVDGRLVTFRCDETASELADDFVEADRREYDVLAVCAPATFEALFGISIDALYHLLGERRGT